jgi:DNA-directed RNA polymerase II subunit RPB2
MNLEVISKYGKSFSIVRVPYCFKLLIHELQAMNIQMRIITEDNIEQLTSMNYAKTIDNLKLTKLTEKEQLEFSKKYDKQLTNIQIQEKTTEQIVKEDEAKAKEEEAKAKEEEAKAKEEEAKEAQAKESGEESDDEGLSQVTIDSIKRAEEEFEKYQDLDDFDSEERSPINIGDEVNKDELGIENLNSESKKLETESINDSSKSINDSSKSINDSNESNDSSKSSLKSVKINESKNEDIIEIKDLPIVDENKEKSLLKLSTTNYDENQEQYDLDKSTEKKTIKIIQQ